MKLYGMAAFDEAAFSIGMEYNSDHEGECRQAETYMGRFFDNVFCDDADCSECGGAGEGDQNSDGGAAVSGVDFLKTVIAACTKTCADKQHGDTKKS